MSAAKRKPKPRVHRMVLARKRIARWMVEPHGHGLSLNLERPTLEKLAEIAELAGVSVNIVVNVVLAREVVALRAAGVLPKRARK
jgi:predicted DNA-binding ribbon-helix-helix protein